MLWDKGLWTPEVDDVDAALKKGDLKFTLDGYKLKGSWVLVRTKGGWSGGGDRSWLLIKHRDEWAGPVDIAGIAPLSVKSQGDFAEILSEDNPTSGARIVLRKGARRARCSRRSSRGRLRCDPAAQGVQADRVRRVRAFDAATVSREPAGRRSEPGNRGRKSSSRTTRARSHPRKRVGHKRKGRDELRSRLSLSYNSSFTCSPLGPLPHTSIHSNPPPISELLQACSTCRSADACARGRRPGGIGGAARRVPRWRSVAAKQLEGVAACPCRSIGSLRPRRRLEAARSRSPRSAGGGRSRRASPRRFW